MLHKFRIRGDSSWSKCRRTIHPSWSAHGRSGTTGLLPRFIQNIFSLHCYPSNTRDLLDFPSFQTSYRVAKIPIRLILLILPTITLFFILGDGIRDDDFIKMVQEGDLADDDGVLLVARSIPCYGRRLGAEIRRLCWYGTKSQSRTAGIPCMLTRVPRS
ncbi:hypothetical protein F5146DRAFT_373606 [Armillaria mellea]|nr:hypothetical protein F5146DRAFT_373606 [Armillaria mellea]